MVVLRRRLNVEGLLLRRSWWSKRRCNNVTIPHQLPLKLFLSPGSHSTGSQKVITRHGKTTYGMLSQISCCSHLDGDLGETLKNSIFLLPSKLPLPPNLYFILYNIRKYLCSHLNPLTWNVPQHSTLSQKIMTQQSGTTDDMLSQVNSFSHLGEPQHSTGSPGASAPCPGQQGGGPGGGRRGYYGDGHQCSTQQGCQWRGQPGGIQRQGKGDMTVGKVSKYFAEKAVNCFHNLHDGYFCSCRR
jgi:hypothetical protein